MEICDETLIGFEASPGVLGGRGKGWLEGRGGPH